jgi:hypothetical protein
MRTDARLFACLCLIGLPAVAFGQDARPLSVIDWLDNVAQIAPAAIAPDEPATTGSGSIPTVTVIPLGESAPVRIGLLPSSVSGLPETLWSSSDANTLTRLLAEMPHLTLPAAQAVFFTTLLADAAPATGKSDLFDLARIDAMIAAGAVDPALAMLEQADPKRDPAFARRYVQASLLNETEDAACTLIQTDPRLAPDYAYRVFCAARAGDWDTAALLLGTARALQTITPAQNTALERFLDPDLFEGEPPLSRPAKPDPLLFRIHEALGQPIATNSWPVTYAHADLRDVAGWKKQLDAAERLARNGALGDNRLLGIYSQRKPAASGGIWDRVASVQRFETALKTDSVDAISKTLPRAWNHMKSAGLAVPFATLFGETLSTLTLPEPVQSIAWDVILASPFYESISPQDTASNRHAFGLAVAKGWIDPVTPASALERAIAAAFAASSSASPITTLAQNGELGHAILLSLRAVQAGADGDLDQLTKGLSALRDLGLEDAARRAALQVLQREDAT